jgi:hypothetical protein
LKKNSSIWKISERKRKEEARNENEKLIKKLNILEIIFTQTMNFLLNLF